jgi:uncharacterized membrane protein
MVLTSRFGFRETLWVLLGIVFFFVGSSAQAAEDKEKKDLPDRAISLFSEYTGVVVSQGESVSLDLTVADNGRHDENVHLTMSPVPKGWKALLKTYSFGITGIHVNSEKSKSVTLRLEPDDTVQPGKYEFTVKAETEDRKLSSEATVTVNVEAKVQVQKSKDISINTSYPVLTGPPDAKFEFSLEVENKLDKDTLFNLVGHGPENWDVNFKPAYEDKFISSLRLKANQSQTVAVEVKPFPLAPPGEYPISVRVSSPEAKGEVELKVVLTGTQKLEAGTSNGLLSLNALAGQEANLSIYVKNSGSAPLNNIRFLSFKPENWTVTFKPEGIDSLGQGDMKQVEVTVKPSAEALVGDYSVVLNVAGEKATKNLELRVTVKASTAWGWIGIGIIVFVMLGLVGLFIRLGRR